MGEAVSYNPEEDSAVMQITTDYLDVQTLSKTLGLQLIDAQYNTSRCAKFDACALCTLDKYTKTFLDAITHLNIRGDHPCYFRSTKN